VDNTGISLYAGEEGLTAPIIMKMIRGSTSSQLVICVCCDALHVHTCECIVCHMYIRQRHVHKKSHVSAYHLEGLLEVCGDLRVTSLCIHSYG